MSGDDWQGIIFMICIAAGYIAYRLTGGGRQ